MTDKAMKDLGDEEISLRVEKDPLIGKKIGGRYEIVSVLGRGGMGVVYKAHQADVDRFVAVKTLHISRIADSQVIQKFRSEAQAVSKVRHPNTVMLYDFGVSQEGVPYLVMDILDGKSFREVLKNAGQLPLGRANYIFQQVCEALAFAHESGIVHKDLKPENIMLCERQGKPDWVYVLDFGIAGLLEQNNKQEVSEIVGSPPYMSPEQCTMQGVDHRSDIYSLAVCLFETLSGKFPFKARTAMEMLDCHVSHEPQLLKDLGTNFSTYESVSQLIAKSMEKRPEKRYQSVKEFAAELNEAVKKDSKRGMQLRTRATLEVESVRVPEVTESKQEEDPVKYHFSTCPHCDAPTEAGISLCLACGRSLANVNDFSKIRASRGDFSLPKYQELGQQQAPPSPQFSKRTKTALNSGKAWSAYWGLFIICAILLTVVFLASGGMQFLKNSPGQNGNTQAPQEQSSN